MVHTEHASKLLVAKDLEMATPSVKLDKDDCCYIFIRLYTPDVRLISDDKYPALVNNQCDTIYNSLL